MPVNLTKINVQSFGPLQELSIELGRFNLIYGENERGKTSLVEFLIRSLFRQPAMWGLRQFEGRGKIEVSGLENGHLLEFSPSSPNKIEDFLQEANPGLPSDFSKLLVVKGAETQIAAVEGGVDRGIINRLLSNKNILDEVQGRVSKTIQDSRLEADTIIGPKRGDIATRMALSKELQTLDRLFSEIDRSFSGGGQTLLAEKKQSLESQIEEMVQAKRFLACTVANEIKRLQEERNRIPAEKIQEARNTLSLLRQKEFEYRQRQEEQRIAAEKSEEYEWLHHAGELYRDTLKGISPAPKRIFPILALFFLLASGVLIALSFPLYAIATLALVVIFGAIYFVQASNFSAAAGDHQELEKLRQTFEKKFAQPFTGLPQLLEMQQRIEEDYATVKVLQRQLTEERNQLHGLRKTVSALIYDLVGERKEQGTWDEVLRLSERQVQRLENKIREKEIYLAKLDIDPSDYLSRPPSIVFSLQKLQELQSRVGQIEAKMQEETQNLNSLKQMLCQQTDDDISAGWETIIENLRNRREDVLQELKSKTGEIIGQIALCEVLEQLRLDEENKIENRFSDPEIQAPLHQLTGRYEKIKLENDRVIVSDRFQDFPLSDLSTGAQEQILLALRIGFSSKMLKSGTLFLIFDDAFQYSDWQRRELLVNKAADLARDGWQIIYFTMDDHIRDLFLEAGKEFGEEFKSFALP